jgi:hypothetical protein
VGHDRGGVGAASPVDNHGMNLHEPSTPLNLAAFRSHRPSGRSGRVSVRGTPALTGGRPDRRAALSFAVLLAAAVLTPGCDRAARQEAGVEASAAAALKAQGAKDARFDVQGGEVRATITQADGREQQVEIGAQSVRPEDFGLPYYPGAAPDPSRSSRMSSAAGQVSTVVMSTPDAPARVLEYYRTEAQGRSSAGAGPALEIPDASGAASVVMVEEATGRATQVRIEPVGAGSEVTLLSTRPRTP